MNKRVANEKKKFARALSPEIARIRKKKNKSQHKAAVYRVNRNEVNITHKISCLAVIDSFFFIPSHELWTFVQCVEFNEVKIYYANLSLKSEHLTIREKKTKNNEETKKTQAIHLPAPFLSLSSSATKRGSLLYRRRIFADASTVDRCSKNPSKITIDAIDQ